MKIIFITCPYCGVKKELKENWDGNEKCWNCKKEFKTLRKSAEEYRSLTIEEYEKEWLIDTPVRYDQYIPKEYKDVLSNIKRSENI